MLLSLGDDALLCRWKDAFSWSILCIFENLNFPLLSITDHRKTLDIIGIGLPTVGCKLFSNYMTPWVPSPECLLGLSNPGFPLRIRRFCVLFCKYPGGRDIRTLSCTAENYTLLCGSLGHNVYFLLLQHPCLCKERINSSFFNPGHNDISDYSRVSTIFGLFVFTYGIKS